MKARSSLATYWENGRVSPAKGLAYGIPVVPIIFLLSSVNVVQGIYAKHYGLALTSISAVLLIAGIFDAVTDPAIGYLSDRYHARTGSRRPFVVCGMVLAFPCAWFLFVPGDSATVGYFVFWYLAMYLGYTLFNIPHMTWGGELSPDSAFRTKAYGYRTLGSYCGLILYGAVPMLPWFATSEITPETMRISVLAAGVLTLPCLYVFLRHVPAGVPAPELLHTRESPIDVLRGFVRNKPYWFFLAAHLLDGMATGVFYGLWFIVVDAYLKLGEQYVFLHLFHLVVATLMLQISVRLIIHLGKKVSWMLGTAFNLICSVPVAFLILQAGDHSLQYLYLAQFLLGTASALGNVSSPSMLTDIIDYDTWKSKRERGASYFSVYSLISKTGLTIGGALGLAIVGLYGFEPSNGIRNADTVFGFSLAMGWLPAVISVMAMISVALIPINERRRKIIRRRLDTRRDRAQRMIRLSGVREEDTGVRNAHRSGGIRSLTGMEQPGDA